MCVTPLPELWVWSFSPVSHMASMLGMERIMPGELAYMTFRSEIVSWKVMSFVVQIILVLVNSLLFLDLYLMTKMPFSSRGKREKQYQIAIAIMSAVLIPVIWSLVNYRQNGLNLTNFVPETVFLNI